MLRKLAPAPCLSHGGQQRKTVLFWMMTTHVGSAAQLPGNVPPTTSMWSRLLPPHLCGSSSFHHVCVALFSLSHGIVQITFSRKPIPGTEADSDLLPPNPQTLQFALHLHLGQNTLSTSAFNFCLSHWANRRAGSTISSAHRLKVCGTPPALSQVPSN